MSDYILTLLIALVGVFFPFLSQREVVLQPSVTEARVSAVVDGDTIKVRIGEVEETVRYIGIDTPEPYRDGKPACWSIQATERNREFVAGKEVRLVPDREDKDKYGRLLRYVYVGETFVNKELLQEGYAKALRIKPNTLYAEDFSQLQETAQEEKRGMWGRCVE